MCYQAKFIKNGNEKLGDMWTFNKLCGNVEIGGCVGTCGQCCKGCFDSENPKKSPCYGINSYVWRGWDKSSIVKGHIRNTNAIRNDLNGSFREFQQQIDRARNTPSIVRVHATGELETIEELKQWIVLAYENPQIYFYVYSKNYFVIDAVLTELEELEEELPHNFTLLISIWHDSGIECFKRWQHLKGVKAFVYVDGYEYPIEINAMCPSYDINGKLNHAIKCKQCGICIWKNVKVIGCYDHGKGGKK